MTLEEAQKQIERCMKILYYRDARSINKVILLCNIEISRCSMNSNETTIHQISNDEELVWPSTV